MREKSFGASLLIGCRKEVDHWSAVEEGTSVGGSIRAGGREAAARSHSRALFLHQRAYVVKEDEEEKKEEDDKKKTDLDSKFWRGPKSSESIDICREKRLAESRPKAATTSQTSKTRLR